MNVGEGSDGGMGLRGGDVRVESRGGEGTAGGMFLTMELEEE
jgi:hypothetical protein